MLKNSFPGLCVILYFNFHFISSDQYHGNERRRNLSNFHTDGFLARRWDLNSLPTPYRSYFMDDFSFVSPIEPILKPCDALLHSFFEVAENFTQCVIANSLPPRVCTRCADYYVELEKAYYNLKDSSDIIAPNGMPCNEVIFSMYETAYVEDLYANLKDDVWSGSRCTDCLEFVISDTINLDASHNYRYNNKTEKFRQLYTHFLDCVNKAGISHDAGNKTENRTVCNECWKTYAAINVYYEESILAKWDYCIDVESAVNDTIRFWRQELACTLPLLPPKHSEAIYVGLISAVFSVITVAFYCGSFMQGSRRKRRLKKYRSSYGSYGAIGSVNDDLIEEYASENEQTRETSRIRTERARLLFAGGRRVISYSQLPPSNLG